MTLPRALAIVVVLGLGWTCGLDGAGAQFQGLTIGVGNNPEPRRPVAPVDNLQDLIRALARCYNPPPLGPDRQPIDVSFRVSFKRSGELFGKPPGVEFVQQVTPEERLRYYQAVAEALDLCNPMPFTDSMGGAAAGRVFKVNFVDMRKRKQTLWLKTKTL